MSEPPTLELPSLDALRKDDPEAWDQLHDCLLPVAMAVAQSKLGNLLPQDVEDVAMLACEAVILKVEEVATVEELRPLVASIAYCRSVDRLRRYLGPEGGPATVPTQHEGEDDSPPIADAHVSPEEEIRQRDIAGCVQRLLECLKPRVRRLLV